MKIETDLLDELLEYCKELTEQLEQARKESSSDDWEGFEEDYPFLSHVLDSSIDIEDTFLRMTGKIENQ